MFEAYLSIESIERIGSKIRTGCKREEKNAFLYLEYDIIDRTKSRSMRAPLNPRKKNLIQIFGEARSRLRKLPRRSTPNHKREEKKDSAK